MGLRRLSFTFDRLPDTAFEPGPRLDADEALLFEAIEQVEAYFDGRLRVFDLPLDLDGTPFQVSVWRTIASIPFGETASYAEVAVSAGAPGAHRAAGSACGVNPVFKAWLLRHEIAPERMAARLRNAIASYVPLGSVASSSAKLY